MAVGVTVMFEIDVEAVAALEPAIVHVVLCALLIFIYGLDIFVYFFSGKLLNFTQKEF